MRRVALAFAAVLATACAKPETPPAAQMPAASTLNLADLAGTWTAQVKPAGKDTVIVTSTINATADAAGWTMTLPDRGNVPMTVTVAGDSAITSMGPYESVLRKGVQVKVDGVMHLVDGKLMGALTAHYATSGADSVVKLDMTATRMP